MPSQLEPRRAKTLFTLTTLLIHYDMAGFRQGDEKLENLVKENTRRLLEHNIPSIFQ